MSKLFFSIFMVLIMVTACSSPEEENPFFAEWETPFGVPPFDKIKNEHYRPAFEKGIEELRNEVNSIANSEEDPTFANTLEAMEANGELLNKVSSVFYNLTSANTNDSLQAIARDIAPELSKVQDDIYLNAKLFERIKAVYDKRNSLGLNTEEMTLLTDTYKSFVRGGANLNEEDKEKLREINERLSVLSVQFGENLLAETNAFELVIDNEEDLSGLPDNVIATAAEEASSRDYEGKWVFTVQKPSMIPFLQYADNRDLREKIMKGYINRGDHNNEYDNKEVLKEMANLRLKKANLLGYETHAHYVLEDRMAKNPENVYELMDKVWEPALNMAKKEAYELQQMIYEEGHDFKLKPWDWWYYAEKVKQSKYSLDEEEVRPYLQMENVREGAFMLAEKLFGIKFVKRTDLPVYHPEVETFEVHDADGSLLAIYYTDYYPRASKRAGAWMNTYRDQKIVDGENVRPIVVNVGNFAKPTKDNPSLLTIDQTNTLFHEFGHALHGIFANTKYSSLSGTSVPRDFVEMPSQVFENWVFEPEMLALYAKHYETGEVMPTELVEKIKNANKFNKGFETVEFLSAAYLDMDWHTRTEPVEMGVNEFEDKALDEIGLIPEIVVRYRSPYFAHIFSGGYSAGYYSYIWSEVYDADAYEAFKENGIFDRGTAQAFRKEILAKGGTEDAMELYKNFRGQEPSIEPLLKRRGLK